jgi:hypothetical protein
VSGALSTAVPSTVTWAVSSRTAMPARWVCPGWKAVEATFCSPVTFPSSSTPSRISRGQNEAW